MDDGRVIYAVGEDSLGLAVNMESQLASHISSNPAINFLAYIPTRYIPFSQVCHVQNWNFFGEISSAHRQTMGNTFIYESYKDSTIIIYDSRVVPDLKIPHIMTLDS